MFSNSRPGAHTLLSICLSSSLHSKHVQHCAAFISTIQPPASDNPNLSGLHDAPRPKLLLSRYAVCRYVTQNNIWLVLEYCVGGALIKLLQEDLKLPPAFIRAYGADLATALQYLHSQVHPAQCSCWCHTSRSSLHVYSNMRAR